MSTQKKHMAICGVELIHTSVGCRRVLKQTIAIYRAVCKFIGTVVEEHWDEISVLKTSKKRLTFVESLIHTTKDNIATYKDFDNLFYKFPSYYRRAAINFVLGEISSYHTRLAEYNTKRKEHISNGKRFREKPPTLNLDAGNWPVLYKDEVYTISGATITIKVFIRNTWDWITVAIPNRDYNDLNEKASIGKLHSPTLVYKYHKYYLEFPIEYPSQKFPEVPLNEQIVLALDLGVNRGAVASVMNASGTILGRYFDPYTRERDQIDHLINKIKKAQRLSGTGNSLAKLYTKLDGVKNNYVCHLARWIADLAAAHGVYGVVLENLKRKGRNMTARIHHWCKCRIRDLVKGICRRYLIRVFLVNPKNTSALAYDGSGKVTRGEYISAKGEKKYNYSVCTFPSGKQYNCDLNASYNIGARYFIRAYQKSMLETEWSQFMTKVPELAKRTSCTLSTLRSLTGLLVVRQNCNKSEV